MNITLRFVLYAICAFAIGFSDNYSIIIYICFFMFGIYDLWRLSKIDNTDKKDNILLNIVLYSVIMPDNYIAIIIIFIVLFLKPSKSWMKISKTDGPLFFYVTLRILLGIVDFYSIIVSFLYWGVFTACLIMGKNFLKNCDEENVIQTFKEIVVLQLIPVFIKALLGEFRNSDLDWVYGTMGFQNGVQMFILGMLITIYFFSKYMMTKRRTYITWSIASMIMGVLTGSIAMTLITVVMFAAYMVLVIRDWKMKFAIGIVIIIISFAMVFSNKTWVKNDIINLTNIDYMVQRLGKLQIYQKTFVELPKENVWFFVFGQGVGRYSSRAAMTLTGDYISVIDIVDMSDYTEKYVYPLFHKMKAQNSGTANSPFSEICTIQGELGTVGLLLLLVVFVNKFAKASRYQKLVLMMMLGYLFYDNYLEYPRIAFVILLIYYLLRNKKKSVQSDKKMTIYESYTY